MSASNLQRSQTRRSGHIGLTSMRERASLAGGWFRIESAGGSGTIAEAWIPREEEGAAA